MIIIILLLAVFLLSLSAAPAFPEDGFRGWLDLNLQNLDNSTDGATVRTDSFTRNIHLQLDSSLTRAIQYRLYLRGLYTDSDLTDTDGTKENRYRRTVEPGLDMALADPVYNLSFGARHLENWSTASFNNSGRSAEDHYYGKLNITPYEFPSLSFYVDRRSVYDFLPVHLQDMTLTTYSSDNNYNFAYKGFRFSYDLSYSRNNTESSLKQAVSSQQDQINAQCSLGYGGNYLDGKGNANATYRGSYVENKMKTFTTSALGNALTAIPSVEGLYAAGTFLNQNIDLLNQEPALIDNNESAGISAINIGAGLYHNIGFRVFQGRAVEVIYLYVDHDVSSDISLNSTANWKVYRSDSNLTGATWTEVALSRVAIEQVDPALNTYRYVFFLSASQDAPYFKVVNLARVTAPGITDVFVTEIRAAGPAPSGEGETRTDEFYQQELSLGTNLRAGDLLLSLSYSLRRDDQNPSSAGDAFGGLITGIYSSPEAGAGPGSKAENRRVYNTSVSWLANKLLTLEFLYQRQEDKDTDERNLMGNLYTFIARSAPLPTLSASLTLSEGDTSQDGYELHDRKVFTTVGAQLYKGLDLATDIGYQNVEGQTGNSLSDVIYLHGFLSAVLTPELTGHLNYSVDWALSGTGSKGTTLSLDYRPGRFIFFTGDFRLGESQGASSTFEGVHVNWLPYRVIRLELDYQHGSTDPGPAETSAITGQGIWMVTRFIDFRVLYMYSRNKSTVEAENHLISFDLDWRF